MTRLAGYGLGEIVDRLTILALKIHVGAEQGKAIVHFEAERQTLLKQLRTGRRWTTALFGQALDLAAVNGQLWHAEDDLRDWREKLRPTPPDSTGLRGPGEGYKAAVALQVVDLAMRIQQLNDRRAALVQQINKEAGDGAAGKEKL